MTGLTTHVNTVAGRSCISPLSCAQFRAFSASRRSKRGDARTMATAGEDESRKDGPLEGMINSISVAVTNFQPLNDGKKWLAKIQAGDYAEGEIAAKLDQYIQNNSCTIEVAGLKDAARSDAMQVVVFSWSRCPFCVKAKTALGGMNAKYLAVELDQMPEGAALRAELAKRTNRTSMPNIFVGQKPIGGCNDGPGLMTLDREGKLRPMLQSAGAL